MITLVLVTVSLLTIAWSAKGIPISNRSSGASSGFSSTHQLSREYLPVENSKIKQDLDYYHDHKVILTTKSPLGIIPIVKNEHYTSSTQSNRVSKFDKKIYRPSGIIGDSIVEYETPTRPVQEEVIDTEYQQFVNDGQHEITTLQSTGHTFSNALKSHERGEKNFDYSAQTVASAITTLDWLLCNKGYNSPIHPPPSPVLALVLSKYGRYLPVTRGSRVYSYMATNNIHNSQPFGQYKFSREHDDNIEA